LIPVEGLSEEEIALRDKRLKFYSTVSALHEGLRVKDNVKMFSLQAFNEADATILKQLELRIDNCKNPNILESHLKGAEK